MFRFRQRLKRCLRRSAGCGTRVRCHTELDVGGTADIANGALRIDFANTGQAGACFHVRSGNTSDGPWTYTVEAGQSLSDTWNIGQSKQGRYDLSVYGPNGFLRTFRGSIAPDAKANLDIDCGYDVDEYDLVLVITNRGPVACRVSVANAYDDDRGCARAASGPELPQALVAAVELRLVRCRGRRQYGSQVPARVWPVTWRTRAIAQAIPPSAASAIRGHRSAAAAPSEQDLGAGMSA